MGGARGGDRGGGEADPQHMAGPGRVNRGCRTLQDLHDRERAGTHRSPGAAAGAGMTEGTLGPPPGAGGAGGGPRRGGGGRGRCRRGGQALRGGRAGYFFLRFFLSQRSAAARALREPPNTESEKSLLRNRRLLVLGFTLPNGRRTCQPLVLSERTRTIQLKLGLL